MYTRCPSCSATFRVTAALLQMAEGDVRCGSCGVVFNALHTLVDDWTGADFTLPGAPKLSPPGMPQDPAGPPPGMPPAAGASGRPVDEVLEFNVPETEWQRFFITPAEAPARAAPDIVEEFEPSDDAAGDPATDAEPPATDETVDEPLVAMEFGEDDDAELGPPRSLEEETADTDTWKAFLRETEAETATDPGLQPEEEDDEPLFVVSDDDLRLAEVLVRRPAGAAAPGPGPQPGSGTTPEPALASGPVDAVPAAAADAPELDDRPEAAKPEETGEEPVAPGARRRPAPASTVLDWGPPPTFTERVPRPPAHTARWLALSVAAALVLAAQAAHYSRDALAADPRYGAIVREAYDRLGLPLHPGWPLDSYEIRGAKAIAENSAPGALDIVAEIAVTGPQPVGLPMVRVVLRDRWSNPVASGIFDAATYLAEKAPPAGVYAPGSLIPLQISLKDPGSAAQGYELDVCVPNRRLGLQCRSARDPFRN